MDRVPHTAIDACLAWEQRVERILEEPVISVEAAIVEAVHYGRMTAEEGQECLNAYLATFFKDEPA